MTENQKNENKQENIKKLNELLKGNFNDFLKEIAKSANEVKGLIKGIDNKVKKLKEAEEKAKAPVIEEPPVVAEVEEPKKAKTTKKKEEKPTQEEPQVVE